MNCQVTLENHKSFDIALGTLGAGILVHPIEGTFSVKVKGEYTKTNSVNNIGLYNYTVTFLVELGLIIPTLAELSTSVISDLRSQVVTNVTNYIKGSLTGIGI
jgi:prophage DNA circulation protein